MELQNVLTILFGVIASVLAIAGLLRWVPRLRSKLGFLSLAVDLEMIDFFSALLPGSTQLRTDPTTTPTNASWNFHILYSRLRALTIRDDLSDQLVRLGVAHLKERNGNKIFVNGSLVSEASRQQIKRNELVTTIKLSKGALQMLIHFHHNCRSKLFSKYCATSRFWASLP